MTDKTDVIDLTGLLAAVSAASLDHIPYSGRPVSARRHRLLAMGHVPAADALLDGHGRHRVLDHGAHRRDPREGLDDLRISSGGNSTNSPAAVVAFFAVHCGIFMGVHFLFLWVMFSDAWARRIHGPTDFVRRKAAVAPARGPDAQPRRVVPVSRGAAGAL
jgi:hypothetical protein